MLLPRQFWVEHGRPAWRGGVERAFMSTTTDKDAALLYANGKGTVVEIRVGRIKHAESRLTARHTRYKTRNTLQDCSLSLYTHTHTRNGTIKHAESRLTARHTRCKTRKIQSIQDKKTLYEIALQDCYKTKKIQNIQDIHKTKKTLYGIALGRRSAGAAQPRAAKNVQDRGGSRDLAAGL